MKDIDILKSAILAQAPRFAIVANPESSPIPVEGTLDEVINELKARLKLGKPMHAPAKMTAGEKFSGLQLIVTDPPPPQGVAAMPKTILVVQIYTDLAEMSAQTDQNMIAYAIQAIVVQSFINDVKADQALREAAQKAPAPKGETAEGGVIENFPSEKA